MQDTWAKFLSNAMSLISVSAENLQKTLQQLTEDRKISLEEGRKLYDDFIKNTEHRREDLEEQLKKIFERIAKNLNFAPYTELEHLKKRIEELEDRVAFLEQTQNNAKSN
jgi:polyhydroxyalkanoate synthesis regulator phasin